MNTILFDLDGTLLPMQQEEFIMAYTTELAIKCENYGYNKELFMKALWLGTKAMFINQGGTTNEEVFWKVMAQYCGTDVRKLDPIFHDFYQNEFYNIKKYTSETFYANACIQLLKEKGYQVILATNPVFPPIATHTRMQWAGLTVSDFLYITTYDNSYYCKPNLRYYEDIIRSHKLDVSKCLMVGNDVKEDMCAKKMGLNTFLVTDCLIQSEEVGIEEFEHGSLEDFYQNVKTFPKV